MVVNDTVEDGNLPWVEKYRPATLGELVSHKEIINTCKLNASDDRGIGIVREQIINFAQTKTLHFDEKGKNQIKLIILDEADAMTKDAQSALRILSSRTNIFVISELTESHTSSSFCNFPYCHSTENVRFCIICNYLSKIIPAVQSRCTRFRFAPLAEEQILPRIREIVKLESLEMTEDGENALLKLSEGDMRRVLNILQSTAMAFPKVDERSVYLCVGQPLPSQIEQILRILLNDSFEDAFTKIEDIRRSNGFAVVDILRSLHEMVFDLDISSAITCGLIARMAHIEYRLSQGCTDRIQLSALIAAFINARSALAESAPSK
ncbi:unnamed protein product [Anisakis simplex]|uniref:Activator 1 subunit 5 n=1 Tax=Anisakis simplex TaxID=6269 RepID=A0A0M3K7X3_ANISI|nr:unnamed protein product [Anisakis simplex]